MDPFPSVNLRLEEQAAVFAEDQPQPAGLLDVATEATQVHPPKQYSDPLRDEPSFELAWRYACERLGRPPRDKDDLIGLISRDVAEIDRLLSEQVNAILHHERFQRLEAAWRGLEYLVHSSDDGDVRIGVLQLPKKELATDLDEGWERSDFFRKVYEEEYGVAGGEPFGVILADYQFQNTPSDVNLLERLAEVGAAAFAPVIAGLDPKMFGIPHFGLLERILSVAERFNSLQFVKWNALRDKEDARFLGLALPRILMRLPYERDVLREDGFLFEEDVAAPDRSGYLWGSAAFAFVAVLIRAFLRSGWFADIRGTNQGVGAGGVVDGLPVPSFRTDRPGVATKSSVETMIREDREKELSDLGFITLCHCDDTQYAAFFANPSLQKPKVYDDPLASTNARMSAMLQYTLCASRFAHYLKVLALEQVGRFTDARALQSYLHSWLQQFVAAQPGASPSQRARFPLRDAKIELRDHPRNPGHFLATLYLSPHMQLDELTASVKLISEFRKD